MSDGDACVDVDEPPILVGIATAEGGVDVAVDAPFDGEPRMGHAAMIVGAARAIGVEVPEDFVFSAGQVFYKDRERVEVRLSGFVNAGAGELEASPRSTPVAPQLTADAEGALSLAPADAGRAHYSAMVVRTSDGRLTLSILWDLRDDAEADGAAP